MGFLSVISLFCYPVTSGRNVRKKRRKVYSPHFHNETEADKLPKILTSDLGVGWVIVGL